MYLLYTARADQKLMSLVSILQRNSCKIVSLQMIRCGVICGRHVLLAVKHVPIFVSRNVSRQERGFVLPVA